MAEVHITSCKKCYKKYVYVCTHCANGGCSTAGCEYQGFNYVSGGLFSSGGVACMRCGKRKAVQVS